MPGADRCSGGRYLFAGTSDGELRVFDIARSTADAPNEATWTAPALSASAVGALTLHPTRPLLATAHGERVFPPPLLAEDSDSDDDDTTAAALVEYSRSTSNFDNALRLWSLNE